MVHDGAANSASDAADQTAAPLSFAGPLRLIPGEDVSSYDQLLARMTAALNPADVFEEIWVRDMVDLVWDTLRLRRLKASLLAASARRGLISLLHDLNVDDAFSTAHNWVMRQRAAVGQVEGTLANAGMSIDSVMAKTLSSTLDDIVRIDRMAVIAETRRTAILREIDRRRAGFAQRFRKAVDEAEAGEPQTVADAPALAPA